MWVSIKDNKVGITNEANNKTLSGSYFPIYMDVTGSGADYTFDSGKGNSGTLKFTDTSVTVNFKENTVLPSAIGKDIVCNKK